MNESTTGLAFEEQGIAAVLAHRTLRVPLNQRPYAWTVDEVTTLHSDLYKAFDAGEDVYFLGTIVLTRGPSGQWEVADGQQRLATTSVLIAAARDYLLELGDDAGAIKYQSNYLLEYDVRKKDYTPKLHLNFQDQDFFKERILKPPSERKDYDGVHYGSHDRLAAAAKLSASFTRKIVAPLENADKPGRLYDWIDFLSESARVFLIKVPGRVGNAFKMFETLNARGMEASKVDIIKNYLFDLAKDRSGDVHPRWISMLGTIEGMGEDDLLITFVRHYWISQHGPTRLGDLGTEVERAVRTERHAVDMLAALSSSAVDYVAMLSPRDHPRWNEFTREARNALYTITRELGVEQIRPLILAVSRNFPVKEAEKAFLMMVSWSVRFLIAGGGGGGVLDRSYGIRAREVSRGDITSAKQLREKMLDVVPGDVAFKDAFESISIRKTNLARYYLRSLELHVKEERRPQVVPSEDTLAVNLEHVLPVNPSNEWRIEPEIAEAYYRRLGNMVLLNAQKNVEIGNAGFEDKKNAFKKSPFVLTSQVARYSSWGPDQINRRQAQLAAYATDVWPI